jgi:CheY-like chemotaxis protein
MAEILVLEDNESFREVLVENLEDEGHIIHQAGSGNEAISLGSKVHIDLLITDVRMAGIDGIEALAGLRQLHPKLKSIVITGFASDDAPPRAIGLGACDYLYKPFKLRDLLRSIERTLNAEEDQRRGQAALAPLLAGYRKVAQTVSSLLSNKQLQFVEAQRQEAYTGFFVAMRSQSFDQEQALKVWDVLEDLENKRQTLKEGGLDIGLCRELAEGYKWVLTILKSLKEKPTPGHAHRAEGKVSRKQFAHFYEAVQSGRIPAAQLPLAPFLRTADAVLLGQSEQLGQLYGRFWGGVS